MRLTQPRLRLPVCLVAVAALTALASACSSSGGGSTSPGGTVKIDELVPLTGPSAAFGPEDDIPGFVSAATAINAAGGIMGKHLTLIQTDLGADPADSVANIHQMLATNPGLNGVVGLTSDTALVDAPILDQANIATITEAGTILLDHVHFKYLYRDFPPDSTDSVAMAAYALKKGWTRAAFLVGENSGSQSVVPPLRASYTKHGGTIVDNEALPLDQTSYQVELSKVLAAKPQVIFYETDAQTAATIFQELKSMNNLSIPIVGTSATALGPFWQTASQAVGGYNVMNKFFIAIQSPSQYNSPAYATFYKYFRKAYPKTVVNVYLGNNYDSVIIMALAMDMAHSTDPRKYVSFIPKVVDNHSAPAVASYAAGVAAIKAGKPFYYNTTLGPISFNQYHSIAGTYVAQNISPDGKNFVTVENLPNDLVASYE
jgi:ABC-type branched-subunit amino acid transport system substrate-binding protein